MMDTMPPRYTFFYHPYSNYSSLYIDIHIHIYYTFLLPIPLPSAPHSITQQSYRIYIAFMFHAIFCFFWPHSITLPSLPHLLTTPAAQPRVSIICFFFGFLPFSPLSFLLLSSHTTTVFQKKKLPKSYSCRFFSIFLLMLCLRAHHRILCTLKLVFIVSLFILLMIHFHSNSF